LFIGEGSFLRRIHNLLNVHSLEQVLAKLRIFRDFQIERRLAISDIVDVLVVCLVDPDLLLFVFELFLVQWPLIFDLSALILQLSQFRRQVLQLFIKLLHAHLLVVLRFDYFAGGCGFEGWRWRLIQFKSCLLLRFCHVGRLLLGLLLHY